MVHSLLSLFLASTLNMSTWTQVDSNTHFDQSSLLSVSKIPLLQEEMVSPAALSGNAILALDLKSQSILYEKNSLQRVPIASLTKLMTAYIVLQENDPNETVTISGTAASIGGSRMGLYVGEQITAKNLLYGLLIESGNDAALALAEFNAGNEAQFITKMNMEAKKLGLENTHFSNSTGLDTKTTYSSARDLATLSSQLLQDQNIRDIVNNSKVVVNSVQGDQHELNNTNVLLGELGVKGLKTGKTPEAGECLIALAETPTGHEVLTVVLGSGARFYDTRTLLDWIYQAYIW